MDENRVIGTVIRKVRKEKELSQFDISSRSGINLSYFCRIERGDANPTIRILYSITRALDISPAQFFELVVLEMQYLLISAETSRIA